MVDVPRGLAPFSTTRPPTPPKERNDTTTELANEHTAYLNEIIHPAGLDTPYDSPSSSGDYFGAANDRGSKRVVFSPWTKYHKPLSLGSKTTVSDGNVRPLPPSRDCQSLKSILKPYIETATTPETEEPPAVVQGDTHTMLRSATQHLASPLRSSRLDAYMTMLGCMSAYEDVPDAQALTERLVELMEFIRRDVSARMEATGAPDTQLATQALKLLTTLLCTGTLGDSIPEDFSSFIMDRSISAIEDPGMPKILVSHYMQLLVKQNFPAKVISNDRANRLLSALNKIETRVNGNRVISHRLMIYERLLTQAKSLMKLRVADWMEHLVMGMLSTVKDTRARAIAFGLEAGLALGTTSTVSQTCVDIFNRESPEGMKVVDFFATRLKDMVKSKEDGVHVPQIWIIAIIFLRSKRRQLEHWEHLRSWLVIIQQCFNSSDAQIKFQANIAWNRLVFAVNPDTSTSPSLVKMLRQPVVAQLERKANDKHSRHAKQIARSSYCNLLYYAFRPVPTFEQLDQYWEHYVSQVIPTSFLASTPDTNHACEILAALFGGTAPKVWDENRANTGGPVKPEDLPCLDPKWVRRRASTILKTLDKILDITDWQLDVAQNAPIMSAWRSFLSAVGEAGNKEIKVSMESMTAVAHILTTIKRSWERSLKQPQTVGDQDLSQILQKINMLIQEAVTKIGVMPFTEKRLVQNSQDSFEAAETPSSRSIRQQGLLNTPVLHLLRMIVCGYENNPVTPAYHEMVESLVTIALQSATSRRSKLGLLRDVVRLLPTEDRPQSPAKNVFWQVVADHTKSAIEVPITTDNHNESSQYAGHDYREAMKILEAGIQQQSWDTLGYWKNLSNAIVGVLHKEIGGEGVILVFTEPLAQALLRLDLPAYNNVFFNHASTLLEHVSWPQSRQSLERAHKVLWGTNLASHKPQSLDPFDNVYAIINTLLSAMYRELESEASTIMIPLLADITSLIARCPPSCTVMLLKRIQYGLCLWVEDAKGLMASNRSETLNAIYAETKKLWAATTLAIENTPKIDKALLTSIHDLIVSSLTSHHQSILNQSIRMWNSTFGNAESLEYRDDLRAALIKMKSITEMRLPNFPEDDLEAVSSPIAFVDSQDDSDNLRHTPHRGLEKPATIQRVSTPKTSADSLKKFSAPSWRAMSRRSAEKPKPNTTPKARLRHNDSQIHFAAIDSSSPLVPMIIDSQLLTERQKEVKERQERDAVAIFPNIRSSPSLRPQNTGNTNPPKLVLSGSYGSRTNLDADEDLSPVLPSDDALVKDILGSSPTPRSSRRVTLDLGSGFEPPSSPPTAPSIVAADQRFDTALTSPLILHDRHQRTFADEDIHPKTQELQLPQEELVSIPVDEHITMNEHLETVINVTDLEMEGKLPDKDHCCGILPNTDVAMSVDAPSEPISEYGAPKSSAEHDFADGVNSLSNLQGALEVDSQPTIDKPIQQLATPLSPRNTSAMAQGSDLPSDVEGISGVMDSFCDVSTSFYSNEDDQIAAQLVNDLERASQQASPQKNEQDGTKRQINTKGRKRKSESWSLRQSKRPKSLPSSQGIEVIVETRKPGDINDCAIVDTRPATSNFSSLPQEVKQERSPSPSRNIETVAKVHQDSTESLRGTGSLTDTTPAFRNSRTSFKGRKTATEKVEMEKDNNVKATGPLLSARRRSARLSQASTDSPRIEPKSSAKEHSNSAEVSTDGIVLGDESSDRKYGAQLESHSEGMDQSEEAPDPRIDRSGSVIAATPPLLANEALPRASRKPESCKTQEAKYPQARGIIEEPLDEGEQNRKRQAVDATQDYDVAVQGNFNPKIPHAPRSSARGLLGNLRQLLGDMEKVVFGEEEEGELMNLLFASTRNLYDAGRRRRMT